MVARLVPENIIVSDATVLINFLSTSTFQLLLQAFGGRLHVTDAVVGEIKLNRYELDAAIDAGSVVIHKIPIDKIDHLMKSFADFHLGEASCLVLAKEKSWKIATDDGAAKRFVARDLGATYLMTTLDILLEMVALGKLEKSRTPDVVTRMEKEADFLYTETDFKQFEDRLRSL
jgi:predicted nucleic acid-binding protein